MTRPRRIGIFGGTFDPIHRAHLAVAAAARTHADLDLVLFVVAGMPPHKRHDVAESAEHRLRLVEAAVSGQAGLAVSRIELDRDGPSYTVDTLQELEAVYPGAAFFLIIGEDSLVDLPKWHAPEGILNRAHLLVVPRPEPHAPIPESLAGHYTLLPFQEDVTSSTEVRRRLAEDEALDDLIPDAVAEVIRQEGYYDAHR